MEIEKESSIKTDTFTNTLRHLLTPYPPLFLLDFRYKRVPMVPLFVTLEVEKSNFYRDLYQVIEFREFVKYSSKNCDHSLPSKMNQTVK